jgi:T5SS/PEP-CTERM-associated repeat protein
MTFVFLGNSATGAGVATIRGTGSKLKTSGNVTVANIGAGTLNVADGAEVRVGSSLTVNNGNGALNLDGGSIYVASNFTNNGKFDFTDGLLQVTRNFQPSASASTFIINGADSDDLPTLDLIGSGGLLNVTNLTVGDNRRGKMLVRQGRALDLGSNGVNIGAFSGGEGTLSVQSGASLATTGTVAVGGNGGTAGGTGTLDISGGTVDVTAVRLFRDGTINLTGGTLAVNAISVLDGSFNWTGGTLRFDAAFALTSVNVPRLLGLDATLGSGQALTSAAGAAVTILTPVVVDGGSLNASSLINQSRLEIRSGSIGPVQNDGLIVGDGVITGAVTNSAAGTIRVDADKSLFFTGAPAPNAGELNLQGGTLDFTAAATNAATGRINGRGTLNFDGGLTNQGRMQFSGGPTDIYGNVTFTGGAGGGEMINSGGANVVTFYGNVTHNGDEIRTSPTNTTVFFGNVTGAGPFTGTGAVRFEGTFTPGNSPAAVSVEGDLQLGADSRLVMELGGTSAGIQYDQLHIGGLLSLDGALDVKLLDGFRPRYGDTFDMLDFGSLTGRFDTLNLPPLDAGLTWDASALYSIGAITAVPEPATLLLVLAGCLSLAVGHRVCRCR